jgi:molecular chaperone GrpE (heat shock protein)
MAIHASLMEPSRKCSVSLDELISKLREAKKEGTMNIFSYHSDRNAGDKTAWKECQQLLADAQDQLHEFLSNLARDQEWRKCFTNADFLENTLNILGDQLDAIKLDGSGLAVITRLENISNNLSATLNTFEIECID